MRIENREIGEKRHGVREAGAMHSWRVRNRKAMTAENVKCHINVESGRIIRREGSSIACLNNPMKK